MNTGIGQSKYRNLTLFQVVWSVPAKVFLTVTFSVLYILTDHDLSGSDVEQDCSYTVFAVLFFFTLTKHFACVEREKIMRGCGSEGANGGTQFSVNY